MKILFSLFLLGISNQIFGQFGFGKIEDIEEIQKRRLVVIIEKPREHVIKKLTRNGKNKEIENYKYAVSEYNNRMKEIVEKYWPYRENGIEYKTLEELEHVGSRKYAVLYCISQHPSGKYSIGSVPDYTYRLLSTNGLNWSWNILEDSEDKDYFDYFTTMVIKLSEKMNKIPVFYTPLPDIFPTKASLIFGICSIKDYFDFRIMKKRDKIKVKYYDYIYEKIETNAPKLKEMNLLIRKDLLNKDFDEKSIKEFYPFYYSLSSKEEIDDAIINEEENTAYIVILPYVVAARTTMMVIYFHYIFNANTNELMAFIKPFTSSVMTDSYAAVKPGKKQIGKKTLEMFTEQVNGGK